MAIKRRQMAAIFSTVEKINVLPIRIKCRIISASFNSRNCFCFKQFSKLAMYWWFGFPEVLKTQITSFFFKKCSNGILFQNLSDLLWEKNVLVIEKHFWNSRLKAENLQKFWDHQNNLFKQWKVRTIFGNRMLF